MGSCNIPPKSLKCLATNFVEPFEELKRAFHAPGYALTSMGCHDATSYVYHLQQMVLHLLLLDVIWNHIVGRVQNSFLD